MFKRLLAACFALVLSQGALLKAQSGVGVDIVAAEYFSGSDPGEGKGTPLALEDTGIAGWRTLAALETSLLGSGTVHTYSVRFKSTAGIWSEALRRTVRIHPKPAQLQLPSGGLPEERSIELQVNSRDVAGATISEVVAPTGSETTENFRFARDFPGVGATQGGTQSYGVVARARGGEWGNTVNRAVLVRENPTQLQTTSPGLAQPELRFGVDEAKFTTSVRLSLRIGSRTVSESVLGRSKTAVLAGLASQIQQDAGLSATYSVASSGDSLSVKLLPKREFETAEVLSAEGLVETDRFGSEEAAPIFFEVSQKLGTGEEISKSVLPGDAFGFAAFLAETAWVVAKFESAAVFRVVARSGARDPSNPLLRRVPGQPYNDLQIQGARASTGAPSVSLELAPGNLAPGASVGMNLSGTSVEVVVGGTAPNAGVVLGALVSRIRSDPLLRSLYAAEVTGGSLLLQGLRQDSLLTAGEVRNLKGLKQVTASGGSNALLAELRYATSDPALPGTPETKIAAEVLNTSFLTAVASGSSFESKEALSTVFLRAVSADGTTSAALKRVAIRAGTAVEIQVPSPAVDTPVTTLSLIKNEISGTARPGFVLGGVLIDEAWPVPGEREEDFLERLAYKIRNHPDLRTVFAPKVEGLKLVLRRVFSGQLESVEVSGLRAMKSESPGDPSGALIAGLEYLTGSPTNPETKWISLTTGLATPGFLTAGQQTVDLTVSAGTATAGAVWVRARAKDGTLSSSLKRSVTVTPSTPVHPAVAPEKSAFAELEVVTSAVSGGVRPGFTLGGKPVDAEWNGGATGVLKVLDALALRICSDPVFAAEYTAVVVEQKRLRVTRLKPWPAAEVEVADLRQMRSLSAAKAAGVALSEVEVGIVAGGTVSAKVPMSFSESYFQRGEAVFQQRVPSGLMGNILPIFVQASSSNGDKSNKLEQRILVADTLPVLQGATPSANGSTALFAVDPALAVDETVALRLGGEWVAASRESGASVQDVLERLVANVRSAGALASKYAARISGGSLEVATLGNWAWGVGELEAVSNVTLSVTKTPATELELEAFAGPDPGLGKATLVLVAAESTGGFVFKESAEVSVRFDATNRDVGLRVRGKESDWSKTLLRRVVMVDPKIEMHRAIPLGGAAVVELLPSATAPSSKFGLRVLGESFEVTTAVGETLPTTFVRLATAVNQNQTVGKVWRAQAGGGRILLETLLPKKLGTAEVVVVSGLQLNVLVSGQTAEEQSGVAKIEIAEILGPDLEKDPSPLLEVAMPVGVPFMTVLDSRMTSLELSGGTSRFAVRALGAGGEAGNWSVGKLVVRPPLGATDLISPVAASQTSSQFPSVPFGAAAAPLASPSPGEAAASLAGVVQSAPLDVTVSIPPWIVRAPSIQPLGDGTVYRLGVLPRGGGPYFYRWYRNSVLLPGASGERLALGVGAAGPAGVYRVLVTGGDPATAGSNIASLPPQKNPGGPIVFTRQPLDVAVLRGGFETVPVGIDAAAFEEGSTRFQIYQREALGFRKVGGGGSVGTSGIFQLPLRGLADGDYMVKVTGRTSDGTLQEAVSQEFQVSSKNGSDVAGVYEAMLGDSGNLLGDNARYRGMVSVTVSKTGAVSGRVCYNEAAAYPAGGNLAARTYIPVVRSFTGALKQSDESGLKLLCTPRLGMGVLAQRQQLRIELDLSQSPPALTATVTDQVSGPAGMPYTSVTAPCVRMTAQLPAAGAGIAGRYIVLSDQTNGESAAQIFLRVLPSGKALWTSRRKGGSGSGTATVQGGPADPPFLAFYEARVVQPTAALSSHSLLGHLSFLRLADNTWASRVGLTADLSELEQQTTQLARASTPGESGASHIFDATRHWSRVSRIGFGACLGCRWPEGSAPEFASFIPVGKPLRLSIRQAESRGAMVLHSYSVTVAPNGLLGVSGLPQAVEKAQVLQLRLDRLRGEMKGILSTTGPKPALYGAWMRSESRPAELGRGWLEGGAPAYEGATWVLESAP